MQKIENPSFELICELNKFVRWKIDTKLSDVVLKIETLPFTFFPLLTK